MNLLNLFGREKLLFEEDIINNEAFLKEKISSSNFLVLGGAGTIGQAVVKELFKRNPKKLHVVDISENNLVELVRDLRSSFGYINGDFRTFAIDIGSEIYDRFIDSDGNYDYVFNLSALKHVRSERDPFTLMRMVHVNILNTIKTINHSKENGVKKYFSVSTDKATNPVNMMGASKRIMELFLIKESNEIPISTARFANVAFSDGSLLHGFQQRVNKIQPIVAPSDVKRYFVTPQESGELCILSCLIGENSDIFFPKLNNELDQITFSEIAVNYLKSIGYEAFICKNENEARELIKILPSSGKWPCYFSPTDTEGEKYFEEFHSSSEVIDLNLFNGIGVVKNSITLGNIDLNSFLTDLDKLQKSNNWEKSELIKLFKTIIPDFNYKEASKNLDSKM